MADFYFYGSHEDSLAVLRALLEKGDIVATANTNYPTRRLKSFRRLSPALLEALAINSMLFLTGPFSKAPLRLWKLDGGKYAGTYCIEQRHGGPALAISMPICKKLDGVIWHLRRGELYYQKHYFDDASQQWLRPSDELKAWHAALVKRIKPALKRTRI